MLARTVARTLVWPCIHPPCPSSCPEDGYARSKRVMFAYTLVMTKEMTADTNALANHFPPLTYARRGARCSLSVRWRACAVRAAAAP